jgi:hypothetical protein
MGPMTSYATFGHRSSQGDSHGSRGALCHGGSNSGGPDSLWRRPAARSFKLPSIWGLINLLGVSKREVCRRHRCS